MARYYRDEREAKRRPALLPVPSQGVDEGYRLVGPGGTLTPVVAHVQWLDHHRAGPDTHVMISFEDGTRIEFPFDALLAAVWHDEQRAISEPELSAAAPAVWGKAEEPAPEFHRDQHLGNAGYHEELGSHYESGTPFGGRPA
ncbi:hypothetical protein [Streptomyces sp. NPDC054787]